MRQSERFYELLETMKNTHDVKRHDYANQDDVFANFRTCEQAGIPAWKGCCVRLGDKFSRIMGFAKKEKLKVKDESIKDTLIDMANYALIALILYEEEQNKEVIREYTFKEEEYGVDKERELSEKKPIEPQTYQVMAKDIPYMWPSVAANHLSTDSNYNISMKYNIPMAEKLANEEEDSH